MRRRDLLIAALAVSAAAAFPRVARLFGARWEFEPIANLPRFRAVRQDARASGNVALIGLERADPREMALRASVVEAPCPALFAPAAGDGAIPVAAFTDYYCAFCPQVSDRLIGLRDEGAPIRIRWHEWPILGPRSVVASRAALAAAEQTGHEALHRYLMRTHLPPGPAALRRLAERFDLDEERFLSDMESEAVTGQLDRSAAIAAVFGFIGTPSLVIGRTAIMGDVSKQSLLDLIGIEQEMANSDPIC
ncbi:DsbA family protein [Albibacillus kandeliae]|uniref:DsbA family protein n=1 Tax=Albibacillus kandeliae TaxID=2174228 RepID=UPI000D6977E7|nr:DsbA family protein [Albibacillus kandeliae]